MVHNRIYKSSSCVSILSQNNPVQPPDIPFLDMFILIRSVCVGIPYVPWWCRQQSSNYFPILESLTLYTKFGRIMAGVELRSTGRSLFKQIEFYLFHVSTYFLSLLTFIINNQGNFQANSSAHSIYTRNKHHPIHKPNENLYCFILKSTFYAGIKIFNSLSLSLTVNKIEHAKYRAVLRKYWNTSCIYCMMDLFCVKVFCNTVVLNVCSVLQCNFCINLCVYDFSTQNTEPWN
jgi:hypothetical protein